MSVNHTFEHDRFGNFTPSDRHLTLLDSLNQSSNSELLTTTRFDGRTCLRATQYVGVLRLGNATLQILPKIHSMGETDPATQQREATKNLLVLLSYSLDLPLIEHHAATLHHQTHDWLEVLTHLFAHNLREQLHAAPHRAYQSFDDDLPLLRGKLRIADQLRRLERQHRFACTFDEFSLDNPLNRVFRFVVERLFFLTSSHANRQVLGELRDYLDPVALLPRLTPANADPARLISRLSRHYQPLLQLARLFLSDSTPQLSPGILDTFNFLFDMNGLFESFVAGFLRKHRSQILTGTLLDACQFTSQARGHIRYLATEAEKHRHFKLIPDLLFHQDDQQGGNQYILILDTKYKTLDANHRRLNVSREDFYQMFAYAHRYHCRNILLLYPQTAGTDQLRKTFAVDDTQFQVTAGTINLTQSLTTHQGPKRGQG